MNLCQDSRRVGEWVAKRTGGQYREGSQAIGLEDGGYVVAGALFDGWNGASVMAHVAADKVNREWLSMIHWYAFSQLGVNCVIGVVSSANGKALRFDEHLGFREQCRLKDACTDGDMVIMTLRKEDARFYKEQADGQT